MTQPQVEKLSALLLRVQENRRAPRVAALEAAPRPVARKTDSSPGEERSVKPAAVAPVPPPPPRRPSIDRRATPLEMAVAGELELQSAAASEARAVATPQNDPRREREPVTSRSPKLAAQPLAAVPAAPVAAAPVAAQAVAVAEPPEAMVPRVIEPDPPRDVARPIAQVVSKHAPPVDATFGAMLKRSLSLRPH